MILGIDDATRCPAIGDLIISGVLIKDELDIENLEAKDSKQMTPLQRQRCFPEIFKRGKVFVEFITPQQIDEENLNDLEAKAVARIYENACMSVGLNNIAEVFIDNWEKDREKFIDRIKPHMSISPYLNFKNWTIEHFADENYKIVGAASVVSKVISDAQFMRYRHLYGDFGSGNPNDKKCLAYLKEHLNCNSRCKGCKIIRKSWITYQRLKEVI